MAYIEIKEVSYKYPLSKEFAIKNLSLTIEQGRSYAILGKNGSGKTTLCNIIRGFIPSFYKGNMTGEVVFDGLSLEQYDRGVLSKRIGYVFQNPFNQITGARETVFEEIAYGLENFGVPRDEMIDKVNQVMELTNIAQLSDKNPFELSGGQQQRVAFASILVLNPEVYVIDEPTSQLDPKESERIYDIILKMKQMGKTIILVEHDVELLAEYVDDVIVLDDGNLIAQGEKHQIFNSIDLGRYGINFPKAVSIKRGLTQNNFVIKNEVVTKQELIDGLKKYF